MPRPKLNQPFYQLGNIVLFDSEKIMRQSGIEIPTELKQLVAVVCYPRSVPRYDFQKAEWDEAKRSFGVFCATDPSRAVEVLKIIFNVVASYSTKTYTNKVIQFVLEHNCLVEYSGKFYEISEAKRNGIFGKKGKIWMVSDLADCQIAQYLRVNTDTAKKARQTVASKGK